MANLIMYPWGQFADFAPRCKLSSVLKITVVPQHETMRSQKWWIIYNCPEKSGVCNLGGGIHFFPQIYLGNAMVLLERRKSTLQLCVFIAVIVYNSVCMLQTQGGSKFKEKLCWMKTSFNVQWSLNEKPVALQILLDSSFQPTWPVKDENGCKHVYER